MTIVREIAGQEHDHVLAFRDEATGLNGFLAIHSLKAGPAVGGVRIQPYRSDLAALTDALRLSRAMTYKVALAELPCGGGKAVIVDHPGFKREAAMQEFGRFVEQCGGRFFTGPDAGVTAEDMVQVRSTTKYCADETSPELGDLAVHTAMGVWHAMRICLAAAKIEEPVVAIQGVGSVGMQLARILHENGCELIVADTNRKRARAAAKEFGAEMVSTDEIVSAICNVFAPCAMGGVISAESIPTLKARVICGSANNVLNAPEDGDELHRLGILYAPDYLANAGGIIRGAEYYFQHRKDSRASIERIGSRMQKVIELSVARDRGTSRIADELAEGLWKHPAHPAGQVRATQGAASPIVDLAAARAKRPVQPGANQPLAPAPPQGVRRDVIPGASRGAARDKRRRATHKRRRRDRIPID
jgi:leucine dehydrogenase